MQTVSLAVYRYASQAAVLLLALALVGALISVVLVVAQVSGAIQDLPTEGLRLAPFRWTDPPAGLG